MQDGRGRGQQLGAPRGEADGVAQRDDEVRIPDGHLDRVGPPLGRDELLEAASGSSEPLRRRVARSAGVGWLLGGGTWRLRVLFSGGAARRLGRDHHGRAGRRRRVDCGRRPSPAGEHDRDQHEGEELEHQVAEGHQPSGLVVVQRRRLQAERAAPIRPRAAQAPRHGAVPRRRAFPRTRAADARFASGTPAGARAGCRR